MQHCGSSGEGLKESAGCYDEETGLPIEASALYELPSICVEGFTWKRLKRRVNSMAKNVGCICIGAGIFMALRCAIDVFNFFHHGEESKTKTLEAEKKIEAEEQAKLYPGLTAFMTEVTKDLRSAISDVILLRSFCSCWLTGASRVFSARLPRRDLHPEVPVVRGLRQTRPRPLW